MIRETYANVYQKLAKDCKANIVPELNTALKNLDKEREPAKIPDLIKKAETQLDKATREIGKVADEAQKAGKKNVKDLATRLEQGLKKLNESINKFEKVAIAEAKSGGLSGEDVKDSVALGSQITKMDSEATKDLEEYGKIRQQLWNEIKVMGEKRWKIIKNFAKSKGVSTNGFRSFPMAIDIMEDECKNANPGKSKALKGGSSQMILADEDDDSGSGGDNVRAEFIKYSKSELKSDLSRVEGTIKRLDTKIDEILRNAEKLLALSDKLRDEARSVGKSNAVEKIVSECSKLKTSAGKVKTEAREADTAVNKLVKLVKEDDGLGSSDGDLRDGYEDLPQLEKLSKEFNGVVDNLEKMLKDLAKQAK